MALFGKSRFFRGVGTKFAGKFFHFFLILQFPVNFLQFLQFFGGCRISGKFGSDSEKGGVGEIGPKLPLVRFIVSPTLRVQPFLFWSQFIISDLFSF